MGLTNHPNGPAAAAAAAAAANDANEKNYAENEWRWAKVRVRLRGVKKERSVYL